MYKIVRKKSLNPSVTLMDIYAPAVAKKANPGQFIILRVDENGERIPLTIADFDAQKGTVTIIFQIVGSTTSLLNLKNEGDYIKDSANQPTPVAKRKLQWLAVALAVQLHTLLPRSFLDKARKFILLSGSEQKTLLFLKTNLKITAQNLYLFPMMVLSAKKDL